MRVRLGNVHVLWEHASLAAQLGQRHFPVH
jgi:hypothetical protein